MTNLGGNWTADGDYWREDDEAWLRDNAPKVTNREAATHFNCLPHVVRRKADRMGLSFKVDPKAKTPPSRLGEHRGKWTDERLERTKRLWLAGVSAAEIAKALGCGFTRSAVLGKIHRSDLASGSRQRPAAPARAKPETPRPYLTAPPKSAGPKRAAPRAPLAPVAKTAAPIIVPDAEHEPPPATADLIPLTALNARTCKWPVGDPRADSFGFCGCAKEPEAVYCTEHARVAVQPQTASKRRADRKLYAYLAGRAA